MQRQSVEQLLAEIAEALEKYKVQTATELPHDVKIAFQKRVAALVPDSELEAMRLELENSEKKLWAQMIAESPADKKPN